jgi:hypothetical protein
MENAMTPIDQLALEAAKALNTEFDVVLAPQIWSRNISDQQIADLLAPFLRRAAESKWQPIETAPKDGTWVLIAGESGYGGYPLRAEVARCLPLFRPRSPWCNHAGDAFTDGGPEPTHWMPLPDAPR